MIIDFIIVVVRSHQWSRHRLANVEQRLKVISTGQLELYGHAMGLNGKAHCMQLCAAKWVSTRIIEVHSRTHI